MPSGNDKVGYNISWDDDLECYATNKGYKWHGSALGGWSKDVPPPPVERKPKKPKISNKYPGRRPNKRNDESGKVIWNEEYECWEDSTGMYWYGTKMGGWKSDPPPSKEERQKMVQEIQEEHANEPKRPKARPPGIKHPKYGKVVTYNFKKKRYQTDAGYYWHGTDQGGWNKKLTLSDRDREIFAKKMKEEVAKELKRPKARPPGIKDPKYGKKVIYNFEEERYQTDAGYYWHGTELGGWQRKSTLSTEEIEEMVQRTKKPMRPQARPPGIKDPEYGKEVTYNVEKGCYQTNAGYYWHGTSEGGWKKKVP